MYRFDLNRLAKGERLGPPLEAPPAHRLTRLGSLRRLRRHGQPGHRRGEGGPSTTSTPAEPGGSSSRRPAGTWRCTPPRTSSTPSRSGWRPRARLEGLGHRDRQGVRLRSRCRVGPGPLPALGDERESPAHLSRTSPSPTTSSSSVTGRAGEHIVFIDPGVLRRLALHRRAAHLARAGAGSPAGSAPRPTTPSPAGPCSRATSTS